tara:strand:- start:365 stop:823 length:459 start_codon:yes stop_codon:yes gene_type:complete
MVKKSLVRLDCSVCKAEFGVNREALEGKGAVGFFIKSVVKRTDGVDPTVVDIQAIADGNICNKCAVKLLVILVREYAKEDLGVDIAGKINRLVESVEIVKRQTVPYVGKHYPRRIAEANIMWMNQFTVELREITFELDGTNESEKENVESVQ